MSNVIPLSIPSDWPPQPRPPRRWRDLVFEFFLCSAWDRAKFFQLEAEIFDQVKVRPRLEDWPLAWPETEVGREVVRSISLAIAKEKGIHPPTIHPDDSIYCLFWGAYDDLTPLCFALEMRNRFNMPVDSVLKPWIPQWDDAKHPLWTARLFVQRFEELISDSQTGSIR